MENRENKSFHYTYSAKEQEEIKSIRKKYEVPKEEDMMALLRRLDASVTKHATAVSLVAGVIGALILGFGMSLTMTELGESLNLEGGMTMFLGIVAGITGIILVSVAYPVYNHIVKKEREKITPEIIRLTDELMK